MNYNLEKVIVHFGVALSQENGNAQCNLCTALLGRACISIDEWENITFPKFYVVMGLNNINKLRKSTHSVIWTIFSFGGNFWNCIYQNWLMPIYLVNDL